MKKRTIIPAAPSAVSTPKVIEFIVRASYKKWAPKSTMQYSKELGEVMSNRKVHNKRHENNLYMQWWQDMMNFIALAPQQDRYMHMYTSKTY